MRRASSAPSSRLWLAAHAADMDELALEPVLEMLARRRTFIVREGVVELANGVFSPIYRFTHGLYQEIVLEHTAPKTRADAHSRAGRALERVFAGREHEAAADLACHFHGAGDHLRAARYLRVAAGNALKRYAPREAAALLHGAVTHAAHLAPDERARVEIPLMLELGQAQLAAGETEPRHPHPDQARAPRRRRAPSRRSPPRAADPRRSASRESPARRRSAAPARSRSSRPSRADANAGVDGGDPGRPHRAAFRRVVGRDRRPLPRGVARASAPGLGRAPHARHPAAVRPHVAVGVRERLDAPDAKLLPLALASGNVADCAYCYYLLGVAALHLGRWDEAQTRRRRGTPRSASARAAPATPSRCACFRRGSRSKRQRFDDAYRLSVEDRRACRERRLGQRAPDVAPLRRRGGARAGAARRSRGGPRVACATGMPANAS